MPVLSGFTECGLLDLDGATPIGERIYDAIWNDIGDNLARNGANDAKVYAWALALARVFRATERVERQLDPATITQLLPSREKEFGIVVPETATIARRRANLAVAARLGAPGTYGNIRQALADLLGADFVDLLEVDKSVAVATPTDPTTAGGLFARPTTPRYAFRLTDGYAGATTPTVALHCTPVLDGQPYARPGDRVVLEPDNPGLAEVATVVDWIGGGAVAIFEFTTSELTKAKDAGALIVSQSWPYWTSSKRTCRVKLSTAAAADPMRRGVVNVLMAKMLRGVSTWAICSSLGPFTLDVSHLDVTSVST